ncbi:hypothetical protein ACO22_08041 [Paracoccidioides brasiliensis]|uniref:Uncharacterized protein n=1 Tax=Paracoccidioides brasiliensis TaxID=121759 RepID=A0A1D2J2Z1_PARBR|nr:hypothetical protein ACO22_08041 [Paracoccidioides brasiliensis]
MAIKLAVGATQNKKWNLREESKAKQADRLRNVDWSGMPGENCVGL